MAHDVFVSYSTKDKPTADAICANLESAEIRCWIAPRDIVPGLDFPTAISNAISASRVMVLVLSAHSNASPEVGRELILAANRNLIIIPFKIDNVTPEPGKDYYLARTHWLDAMNPPTQDQIDLLVEYVQSFLSVQVPVETGDPPTENSGPEEGSVQTPAVPAAPPVQAVKLGRGRLWMWGIPLVLAIAGGSIYGILSNRPGGQSALPTATPTSMPSPATVSPAAELTSAPSLPAVLPTASSQTEVETLSTEIGELITQNMEGVTWTFTAELEPNEQDVAVTLDSFLSGEHQGTQSFSLPGEYTCKVIELGLGYGVELHAEEYWNLGPYEESIAYALCDKFTRLNTILSPPSQASASPTAALPVSPSPSSDLPTTSKQAEVETLCTEISALIPQNTIYSSWAFSAELKPDENGVAVTLFSFFDGKQEGTQSFTLPGELRCEVVEDVPDYTVQFRAKEYWNLGFYEEPIANAICEKFTRLNTILGE